MPVSRKQEVARALPVVIHLEYITAFFAFLPKKREFFQPEFALCR
jgi:hypothetical protein